MKWQEISVTLSHPAAEALAVFLDDSLGMGVSMDDPQALERLRRRGGWEAEDLAEADWNHDEVRVRFYAAPEQSLSDLMNTVKGQIRGMQKAGLETGSGVIQVRQVDEEDWAHAWKAYFKPTPVGNRLWIQPSWEQGETPPGRVRIWLDPGMAFGTGTHPTTRLCLEVLDRVISGGETVLDIGCGSGILAIAAVGLGAAQAYGVDIDGSAVKVATENSRVNSLEHRVCFQVGTCEDFKATAQVIVANIVATVIISILPCVWDRLQIGGVFIASGIIRERLDSVRQALVAQGFTGEQVTIDGDWVAITVRKEEQP